MLAICWTMLSKFSLIVIVDEFMLEKPLISNAIKFFSSSLSLLIDLKLRLILVSVMPTLIVSGCHKLYLAISLSIL